MSSSQDVKVDPVAESKVQLIDTNEKRSDNYGKSTQFVKLLTPHVANQPDYPNKFHVTAHLKLLHAFRTLKESIVNGIDDEIKKEKEWQCYITIAVRNFNLFVSALKYKFPDNVGDSSNVKTSNEQISFNIFMDSLLPPLDVLLVWHSFLLNPKSYYTNFEYHDFYQLLNYPFPIEKINDSISNNTFIFIPSIDLSDNYNSLLDLFLYDFQMDEPIVYNAYQPFLSSEREIPIYCPCGNLMVLNCKLTNGNDNTGFADNKFLITAESKENFNCKCLYGGIDTLTHDQLRRRYLYFDCKRRKTLQAVQKYYSVKLNEPRRPPNLKYYTESKIDGQIKRLVSNNELQLQSFELKYCINGNIDKVPVVCLIVLRDYMEINPISSTIKPTPYTIAIHEDLVSCVIRQERFINKMIDFNWLHSQFVELTIVEAIDRYHKFIQLMKDSTHLIVPTLDIDLIWHTHQLFQRDYFDYCLKASNRSIIDHNDKIEENRLDDSFKKTCKLYKERFNEDYSLCLCFYCSANRIQLKSVFTRAFKSDKKNTKNSLINDGNVAVSHISYHNVVTTPTERSEMATKRTKYTYNVPNSNKSLPWETDIYIYSSNYINDPLTTFNKKLDYDDSHGKLYKNGMCASLIDHSSACGGRRGACGSYVPRPMGACMATGAFIAAGAACGPTWASGNNGFSNSGSGGISGGGCGGGGCGGGS